MYVAAGGARGGWRVGGVGGMFKEADQAPSAHCVLGILNMLLALSG